MRCMSAIFRYDFNSPYAYLAAERIDAVLPGAEWQPVGFAFILIAQRRVPWSMGEGRTDGVAECERRAAERGLPPIRWAEGWPRESYSLDPLRVALFAGEHGLLREYSMAAFRRMFVDGVALGGEVAYEVAADIGLDPHEARLAAGGWAKERLKEVTDAAIAEGVPGVPTVTVGGEHFWGDDRLEDAARHSAGV
jgi:2-hydroxychromene-2-carboxylate isomerase